MAQVVITFGLAPGRGYHQEAQVFPAKNVLSQEMASSTSSQQTTITSRRGDVAQIVNNGPDDIWVTFGPNPIAGIAATHFIPTDTVREFGPLEENDRAAIINDS